MLLNGGTLDGNRIIGRKTLELMASDHLAPSVKVNSPLMPAGHGFGLGFAVRTEAGMAPFPGSVGQFFWSGMAGTFFWIDPEEDLFAVFMMQGPGQREYIRIDAAQPGVRGGGVTRSVIPGRASANRDPYTAPDPDAQLASEVRAIARSATSAARLRRDDAHSRVN